MTERNTQLDCSATSDLLNRTICQWMRLLVHPAIHAEPVYIAKLVWGAFLLDLLKLGEDASLISQRAQDYQAALRIVMEPTLKTELPAFVLWWAGSRSQRFPNLHRWVDLGSPDERWLVAFLGDPPIDIVRELARDPHPAIRMALAANPAWTKYADLATASHSAGTNFYEIAQQLAKDEDVRVIQAFATNPGVYRFPDIALEMSRHRDYLVRECLASNPAIANLPQVVQHLYQSWSVDDRVEEILAGNPAIAHFPDIVRELAKSTDRQVHIALATNTAIANFPDVLRKLADDPNELLSQRLVANAAADYFSEIARKLANERETWIRAHLASIPTIAQSPDAIRTLACDPDREVRASLACNPAIIDFPDVVHKLFDDPERDVRLSLLRNRAMVEFPDLLRKAAESNDSQMQAALASNWALAVHLNDSALALVQTSDLNVLENLANNPAAIVGSPRVAESLLRDNIDAKRIYQSLAKNCAAIPVISRDVLRKVASDSDLREELNRNFHCPAAMFFTEQPFVTRLPYEGENDRLLVQLLQEPFLSSVYKLASSLGKSHHCPSFFMVEACLVRFLSDRIAQPTSYAQDLLVALDDYISHAVKDKTITPLQKERFQTQLAQAEETTKRILDFHSLSDVEKLKMIAGETSLSYAVSYCLRLAHPNDQTVKGLSALRSRPSIYPETGDLEF